MCTSSYLTEVSKNPFISDYAKLNLATTLENKLETPNRWEFIGKKLLNMQSAKVEASTIQHALPGESLHLCED